MERGNLVRVVGKGSSNFGDVGRILRTIPRRDVVGFGYVVAFSFAESVPPLEVLSLVQADGEYEWEPILESEHGHFGVTIFLPEELKPLELSRERFWTKFAERKMVHHGDVRREANRACNAMRNHLEGPAVRMADHCNLINLFLSAQARPIGFRNATRLSLEGYVELCCMSYGETWMDAVADILFHMLFENREPHQIGDLMPACSCKTKEFEEVSARLDALPWDGVGAVDEIRDQRTKGE